MRVGDDRVIPVDVRVISATNRDLKKLTATNEFRRDLLYRLDVLHVQVPPLRERREDIPLLLRHFFLLYSRKFRKTIEKVSPAAESLLREYEWPGNIRELRNACEQLTVLSEKNTIEAEDVLRVVDFGPLPKPAPASNPLSAAPAPDLTPDPAAIRQALQVTGGNKTKAAQMLGISRTTLWRKLSEP